MVSNMPNQPKTAAHTVRVEPDLWNTARITALTRGENVSDVIRRCLTHYIAQEDAS